MKQEEYRDCDMPYELWLCSFPDISNRQLIKLAEICGGAQGTYYAGTDKWNQVLKEKQVESLKQFTERWKPQEEYEKLKAKGIRLVTLGDDLYPKRLREIPDPPYGLFVKGSLPEEGDPTVAVIGARDCSPYGSFVAERLGEELGRHGITVVSGMARGIDGISQQAALDTGGRSCGVLGCGVDICYPKENRKLYDRLWSQGCLVSSYPPGTPAMARNFPPRNRIVSGLADAVVVVEAREKSGTLITVDMALEQGREVYTVPGRITDRLSDGCNRLIRQGAVPLLNPQELIRELYGLQEQKCTDHRRTKSKRAEETVGSSNAAAGLSQELMAIYGTLELNPLTVEEIRAKLPGSILETDINLNTCLIRLCLENLAVQVSPGCFSVKAPDAFR